MVLFVRGGDYRYHRRGKTVTGHVRCRLGRDEGDDGIPVAGDFSHRVHQVFRVDHLVVLVEEVPLRLGVGIVFFLDME